ncbi:MurR/RpiR family transcriptional regulator [Brevibacillus fulvus]|uniref:DNA-binding MurR/RpiR family transcriptional regulator n=1 Tax=Brevibacillus fulvus TaxID=1125967 RepID=A0A938Y458_9BACL|nr:MurR/RpiR family transcriptional regulator [Brevibacillus fulvus]MBM7591989.1 DNA-binding MurR/RpiR family transcriptional regulator [Brevibacillus fulvus]
MATGALHMIESMLDQLPPSERKIAVYILQHPHEAVNSTVEQLGEMTHSSGAAVIRLCKSLGVKGFQELKMRISGDLAKQVAIGYRDIEANESMYVTVQKITDNSILQLRETAEIMNYEELAKAVDVLIEASRIHLFGIGASSIIALDAQQKFLRINKTATMFTDVHLVASLIANAGPHEVVMGISFSGETQEVIDVLNLAKEYGLTTISLTKYGQSPVASISDIRLHTSSAKEAPFRSAATSSRIAQLHVIDMLFLCMAAKQYEVTVEHIDRTREAIRSLKNKK